MNAGTNNIYITAYLVTGVILALLCSFCKVQAQSSQTVASGANTTAINFSSGCTYNWTNSNPAIGLAASGTGDIAAFKATNNTNSPITATIKAIPELSGFAYIACYGKATGENSDPTLEGGSINVINTITDTKVRAIPIAAFAQGITVSKNGDLLYTTNQNAGKNVKVLTVTNTVSPYNATGYGIALAPDENTYYYTSGTGSSLFAVNTTTNNTTVINVGTNPYGVAVNSDGSRVYVANNGSNTVSVINTVNNNSVTTIPIGAGFKPYGIAIAKTPNEELVYVTNSGNNSVTVFQSSNNGILAVIPVGVQPVGVASTPDGAFVYVTNKGDNTVSVINTATNTVIKTISVDSSPVGVSVTPDGKKVYVANSGSSTVSVISTATNSVSVNLVVNIRPESFGNFISKSDCQAVTFTITVNPTPTTATITTNGSISTLNTVYGTPSTAATFTVSGTTLTTGILVTPPSGFEVSIDDITFGSAVTIPVGPGGNVSAVTVFIRLKANAPANTYSGDVVLSTPGALNTIIATGGGAVAKTQLNITAKNDNKPYGTPLTVVNGSTNFTWLGLQNGETIGSVTLTYGAGGPANAALGTYPGSITPSAPTGGTFLISNYTVNSFNGDLTVNKAPLIITADNKTRDYDTPDPVFTVTYSGFANNESAAQLTTQPVVTTSANANSLPGQYAITATGASATNYTITYEPGILTISPVIQPIIVPNAFTPNNDGINDTWEIKYLASSYPKCIVEVFNRYNERVYFSNGYAVAWNGKYNGTNLPFGTYYYVITTHTNIKPFAGYLTLIR